MGGGGNLGKGSTHLTTNTVFLRACLHQASESVCVNTGMMLVAQFSLTTMESLENGVEPILEQLHCGQ